MQEYKNRYGDIYTFTELENGNIQWSGDFKYSRFGWPNVYGDAYREYLNDNEEKNVLSLEEFKEEVHRSIYELDDNGLERYVGPCEISEKYSKFVFSNQNMINMVDPSGGPYLAEGMEWMGKTIKEFKSNKEGYLIITE